LHQGRFFGAGAWVGAGKGGVWGGVFWVMLPSNVPLLRSGKHCLEKV
jgi:hypothetical protein